VARYVTAVLHDRERPTDDDLVAADRTQHARLDQAFAATVPISADSIAPFAGEYDDGVRVSARGPDLMIDLGYGEMPFRTIPGRADTFVGVGGVLSLLGAQFHPEPDGAILLRIGNLNPDGEIPYGIEVERQTPRPHCP
jgi:hypothetical protein